MRMRSGFLALATAAALARPLGAQGIVKVERLTDGVWAAQPEKGANVGWMLLGDGVLAIDAGADAANGREILKKIAETTGGKPVRFLVLTHSHADHSGGARAFAAAGARVICQEGIAGQILSFVTQVATDPSDPMSGKADLRPVVQSISERSILADGLRNVQIYFLGAAHTKGDLVLYLAGDRILFAGDLAGNGRLPFLEAPDVDPPGWEKALEALAKTPVERVVAGHGDLLGTKAAVNDSLAYVRAVNALARKFVESGTRDESLEAFVRAPENAIPNVPGGEAHVANVQAAVRVQREKLAKKPTPAASPAPTPAAK